MRIAKAIFLILAMLIIAYGASLPFMPFEQSIQIGVVILVTAVAALSYFVYWAFLGSGVPQVGVALRERILGQKVDPTGHLDGGNRVKELTTQIKSIVSVSIPFDQADAAVRMFLDCEADTYLKTQAECQEETRGSVSYYLEPSFSLEEPWYIKIRHVGDHTEVTFWDLNFQLWFDDDEPWSTDHKRLGKGQAEIAWKLCKRLRDLENQMRDEAVTPQKGMKLTVGEGFVSQTAEHPENQESSDVQRTQDQPAQMDVLRRRFEFNADASNVIDFMFDPKMWNEEKAEITEETAPFSRTLNWYKTISHASHGYAFFGRLVLERPSSLNVPQESLHQIDLSVFIQKGSVDTTLTWKGDGFFAGEERIPILSAMKIAKIELFQERQGKCQASLSIQEDKEAWALYGSQIDQQERDEMIRLGKQFIFSTWANMLETWMRDEADKRQRQALLANPNVRRLEGTNYYAVIPQKDVSSQMGRLAEGVRRGRQGKRGMNEATRRKLQDLAHIREKKIRNGKVEITWTEACKQAEIETETAKQHAPELRARWDDATYRPEFSE